MITSQSCHIVVAAGGTAGQLFPGFAVAARLVASAPHVRVTFAGPGSEFEVEHVRAAGFPYVVIPSRPWSGQVRAAGSFVRNNVRGYLRAARFLKHERVAAVVAMAGYACLPMAYAAARRRLPLVLIEPNAVPGKATRRLARSATLVCAAFEQAARHMPPRCAVRVTGNPVRGGFAPRLGSGALWPEGGPRLGNRGGEVSARHTRHLLVLSGTAGAHTLNEHVPRALYKAGGDLAGWKIVHQSGPAELAATRELYRKLGLPAAVVPFIVDMPQMLHQTDLAITRAGGATLSELAVAAVPAILVPYPDADDDHQRRNAEVFAAGGACKLLDERELLAGLDDQLAASLCQLLTDERKRTGMAKAMRMLAQPDAAWDVAAAIRQLVQ